MKKIVLIGPESTGKSSLSERLADHFKVSWCPEYARSYLTEKGPRYQYDDLLSIARGQLKWEDEYTRLASASGHPLLFVDTDMYVMKVWCEYVFGRCHPFILEQIAIRQYDYYLLCDIDLPWVKDDLREYPDPGPRKKLFNMYLDILINQAVPWVSISGEADQRFSKAVNAVNQLLQRQ